MKSRVRMAAVAMSVAWLAGPAAAETAQEAWAKLIGPKNGKQPAYAYVQNDAKLPNVLIYGDSISIGYTAQVRESLKGKANVYRLYTNGGDSSSVIGKVEKMRETMCDPKKEGHWAFTWDVIHFNSGLHDLKYMNGKTLDRKNGKQVFTKAEYEKNLREDIAYFKKIAPKATLIFATTTPVPEGEAGRVAGDAKAYNEVMLKVLKDFPEIVIDDLYSFVKPNHEKWWSKPGNVHYNPEGCKAEGVEVARVIRAALEKR